MNLKYQKKLVDSLAQLSEQKGISKSEAKEFLTDAFIKAFNKEENWDWKNPIDEAIVTVDLDLEKGKISVQKHLVVVEKLNPITKLKEIEITDPRIANLNLKLGDAFIENIDLQDLPYSKLAYLKQLLIQKTREAEKTKLFETFVVNKGKLIDAKIIRVEENYAILDKDGTSIFLPKPEMNSNETLSEGKKIKVYVVEVDNQSKDAQVIASRAHSKFVEKLLEQEIDDIANGNIKIEAISREAGFKTKIAVSSTIPNVDPLGAIIGPKGQKIKVIIDELNGERIDIIHYSTDLTNYIIEALSPAEIYGIKIIEEPVAEGERKQAIVIVRKEHFLPAIGKRGINVKLAAKLLGIKIDVKTIEDAAKENITYQVVPKASFNRNANFQGNGGYSNLNGIKHNSNNVRFNSKEINSTSIAEILEGSDFNEIDFNLEDIKFNDIPQSTKHFKNKEESNLDKVENKIVEDSYFDDENY